MILGSSGKRKKAFELLQKQVLILIPYGVKPNACSKRLESTIF